jgi:hypothetical protein
MVRVTVFLLPILRLDRHHPGLYIILFGIAAGWLLQKKGRLNWKLLTVLTVMFAVETVVRPFPVSLANDYRLISFSI